MKTPILKMYIVSSIAFFACFISCKTNSKNQPISEKVEPSVLVDLKAEADIDALILEFSEINLKKIKQISRPLHIFLFSFDSMKIEMDTLLRKMKELPYVEDAQSNKKKMNRN
jgi:hypothetical protein